MALQAVRLGDIDKVKTNLDRFSRRHYLYDGLVTSHDPEHQVYNFAKFITAFFRAPAVTEAVRDLLNNRDG